jgi:putative Flp pilus-assembly TadE/G-like protein
MSTNERQSGQATVITVLFMTVLIAMAAAVLDVGSWYRADRALQSTVDAAALAGAQALPENPVQAELLALEYAEKNGGEVDVTEIKLSSKNFGVDTITVDAKAPAPGFFARIFGIDSVTVAAKATARAGGASKFKYVAPIVVYELHPGLLCDPAPCSGTQELKYQHLKANGSKDGSGNFGFINIGGDGGTGTSTLGEWIVKGYNGYLGLGDYDARTGNPFSSSNVKNSLDLRMGDVLLFPIYRKLTGGGTKAQYEIIGWVGFRLSGMDLKGNNEKLFGEFTEVIWDGILAESGPGSLLTGVKAVELVE